MVDNSTDIFTADELERMLYSRWLRLQDRGVNGIELSRMAAQMKQLSTTLTDRLARDEYEMYSGRTAYLRGEWVGGYYGGK